MSIATGYLVFLALGVALAIPIVNSATDTSVERREPGLRLRLVSAGWFGLAACVPVAAFWLVFGRLIATMLQEAAYAWSPALWIFCGLPISTAALCGFTRGVRILDSLVVKTPFESILWGLVIGLLSYLIFGVAVATQAIIHADRTTRLPLLLGTLLVVGIGGVLIGWVLLVATSLAGWLLYRLSRTRGFQQRFGNAGRVSRSVAFNWTVAVIVLFHICSLPGSVSVGAALRSEILKERNQELNQAIYYGDPVLVELALNEGADANNTDAGIAPLAAAARMHKTHAITVLLDHGANPNVLDARSSYNTPLMDVVSSTDLEATKALLDHGANVNASGQLGYTPLMFAARWGTPEIVSTLLERGAEVNLRNSADGKTALGLVLLSRDAPNPRDDDYPDREAIAIARKRSSEVIRLLRAAGARE